MSHREQAERLLVTATPMIRRRSVQTLLAAIVHAVLAVNDTLRGDPS